LLGGIFTLQAAGLFSYQFVMEKMSPEELSRAIFLLLLFLFLFESFRGKENVG
jgi:hypothetical protein